MNMKEFFIATVADEIPRFKRVFDAVPSKNTDYKPDPKSKTAVELVNTLAQESGAVKTILETGFIDWSKMKWSPLSKDEASNVFVSNMNVMKDIAAGMSDSDWDSEGTMLGGKDPWKMPRGPMAFMLLLDFIHHRGQLSTYLRVMGGKVPSIYGPSADSGEM